MPQANMHKTVLYQIKLTWFLQCKPPCSVQWNHEKALLGRIRSDKFLTNSSAENYTTFTQFSNYNEVNRYKICNREHQRVKPWITVWCDVQQVELLQSGTTVLAVVMIKDESEYLKQLSRASEGIGILQVQSEGLVELEIQHRVRPTPKLPGPSLYTVLHCTLLLEQWSDCGIAIRERKL